MIGIWAKPGISTLGSCLMGIGVPTSFWNSRSLMPRPNRKTPMPEMPCSALRVTLTNAVTRPMKAPISTPTSSPSQLLEVSSTVQ